MLLGNFLPWLLAVLPGRNRKDNGPPDHDDDNNDRLTVGTLTGRYTGLQNPEYSGVREFRNIPYAEPPLGSLRWKPPRARGPSQEHHYAYRFPPSCTRYMAGVPSLWNSNITDFMINLDGQAYDAGWVAQTSAEDCLSLAVWTPRRARPGDGLPVALFVPGGVSIFPPRLLCWSRCPCGFGALPLYTCFTLLPYPCISGQVHKGARYYHVPPAVFSPD